MAVKRYMNELERALERYEKTFGEEYPYVELKLTAKEAVADIARRVREKIPVPRDAVAHPHTTRNKKTPKRGKKRPSPAMEKMLSR